MGLARGFAGIAFWLGMGSKAYFSNLKLTPEDK